MFKSLVVVPEEVILIDMHKPSCNNLDDHYNSIVHMMPEDKMKPKGLMCHLNQWCAELMVPSRKYEQN